jgi:hypothetical protein
MRSDAIPVATVVAAECRADSLVASIESAGNERKREKEKKKKKTITNTGGERGVNEVVCMAERGDCELHYALWTLR